MVKEGIWKNKKVYHCKICGFGYIDKETARRCEDWCSKHNSCSLKITKNAVTTK